MTECYVKFKNPASKEAINYLVVEYLKYVLYYRGQFPLPLDQLKRTVQVSNKTESFKIGDHTIYCDENSCSSVAASMPKSKNERTKQNFVDSINRFDNFFNQLLGILQTEEVLEVVMSLGANMMSPKELHRISIPNCFEESCSTDNPSKFQRYRLEFFKTLMHSAALQEVCIDNLTPISVLLRLKAGVTLDASMEQKRFYAPPQKCKQVFVHFDNKVKTEASSDCSPERISKEDPPSLSKSADSELWVRLKSELKGFKNVKESVPNDSNINIF